METPPVDNEETQAPAVGTETVTDAPAVEDNLLGAVPVTRPVDPGLRGAWDQSAVTATLAAIEEKVAGLMPASTGTVQLTVTGIPSTATFQQTATALTPSALTTIAAPSAITRPEATGIASVDSSVSEFGAGIDTAAATSLSAVQNSVTSDYQQRFGQFTVRFGDKPNHFAKKFTKKNEELVREANIGKTTVAANARKAAEKLKTLVGAITSGVRDALALMKPQVAQSLTELIEGINAAEQSTVDSLLAEYDAGTPVVPDAGTWRRKFYDAEQYLAGPSDAQKIDQDNKQRAKAQAYSEAIEKVRADAEVHRTEVNRYYVDEVKRLESSFIKESAETCFNEIESERVKLQEQTQTALSTWDTQCSDAQLELAMHWHSAQEGLESGLKLAADQLTTAANEELTRLSDVHAQIVDRASEELGQFAAKLKLYADQRGAHEAALLDATTDVEKSSATEALELISTNDQTLSDQISASQSSLNSELWAQVSKGSSEASAVFGTNVATFKTDLASKYEHWETTLDGLKIELEKPTEIEATEFSAEGIKSSIIQNCSGFGAAVGDIKSSLMADFQARLDRTVVTARTSTELIPNTPPRSLVKSVKTFLQDQGIPMLGTVVTGIGIALLGATGLPWYVAGALGGLLGQQFTKLITNLSEGKGPFAHFGSQPKFRTFLELATGAFSGFMAAAGGQFILSQLFPPGSPVPIAVAATVKALFRTAVSGLALNVSVRLLSWEKLKRETKIRLELEAQNPDDSAHIKERVKLRSETDQGIKAPKSNTPGEEIGEKAVLTLGGHTLRAIVGLLAAWLGLQMSLT